MATVIQQRSLIHSSTGFTKVSEGQELRWPSGGFGIVESHYAPQEGDCLVRGGGDGDPDKSLRKYGLMLGPILGGAGYRLVPWEEYKPSDKLYLVTACNMPSP